MIWVCVSVFLTLRPTQWPWALSMRWTDPQEQSLQLRFGGNVLRILTFHLHKGMIDRWERDEIDEIDEIDRESQNEKDFKSQLRTYIFQYKRGCTTKKNWEVYIYIYIYIYIYRYTPVKIGFFSGGSVVWVAISCWSEHLIILVSY